MKDFRKKVQIIFQDPYGSLDPRMTIGSIIKEPLDIFNEQLSKQKKEEKIFQLMNDVGLSNDLFNRYPHELSGGQCQRVGIARALINEPSVLICDEPVSALDLSIQAQILDLLNDLKSKYNLTLIFVSHDLSVIKAICDKVLVLKHGIIIENRNTDDLFNNPKDDYTKKLISSVPSPIPLAK
jgi:ABC-type microcin C transport system duplicated ATPase subunit YejF